MNTSVPSTRPPAGFIRWMNPYGYQASDPRPDMFEMVEVWNGQTLQQYVLKPADMHPAQNVANLYWRPVKQFGEEVN